MKKLDKQLKLEEESLQYEEEGEIVPPSEVFSFNELRSCADLFRLKRLSTLKIKPIYQRDIVWNNSDQTHFIDSLLKRLPIPSLCFSQDIATNKMEVIDGLQRINTICKFLDPDQEWTLSNSGDVDIRLRGRSKKEIRNNNPEVFTNIENLTLPITLLRCDFEKHSHIKYIFTIFRRLNTGGLKLTNQEIRNAIFADVGINQLLKECNETKSWECLLTNSTGQKNKDDRFRSIEQILKFFAFFDDLDKFKPSLASFLNLYMQNAGSLEKNAIEEKRKLFDRTVNFTLKYLFNKKNKNKLNGATFEALLFGIAKNIDKLESIGDELKLSVVRKGFEKMQSENEFSTAMLSGGLYQKQKVLDRFTAADRIFDVES